MHSITIDGQIHTFRTPWVMGIVNVTPDSFYAGSRTPECEALAAKIRHFKSIGVKMVDIGGYSSRPGADEVTPAEEYDRLARALHIVRTEWPGAIVSVDTFRAEVAEKCVREWGVQMINDISGGGLDPEMFGTVARLGVAYILMHMRGTPSTMQQLCQYTDVTAEVLSDLAFKQAKLYEMGVKDVIIDPGFGFAKTVGQNYELMQNLDAFRSLDAPLLVGISRKSMIYKPLGITPADTLPGTVALNTYALMHGADILRVHDVEEAMQTVAVTNLLKGNA